MEPQGGIRAPIRGIPQPPPGEDTREDAFCEGGSGPSRGRVGRASPRRGGQAAASSAHHVQAHSQPSRLFCQCLPGGLTPDTPMPYSKVTESPVDGPGTRGEGGPPSTGAAPLQGP